MIHWGGPGYRIVCQEMRMLKLVTEAMVKPVGYDVDSVHTCSNYKCKLVTDVCMISRSSLCLFTS